MNDNMVVEALRYMLAEVEEKLTSVEEENARLKEEWVKMGSTSQIVRQTIGLCHHPIKRRRWRNE